MGKKPSFIGFPYPIMGSQRDGTEPLNFHHSYNVNAHRQTHTTHRTPSTAGVWNLKCYHRFPFASRKTPIENVCVCVSVVRFGGTKTRDVCGSVAALQRPTHAAAAPGRGQVPWKLIVLTAHSVLGSFQGCLNSIPSMPNHAHS